MVSARRTLTTAEAMQTALDLRVAGRLAEADEVCRQILQAEPDNTGAVHLSGVIAYQLRDHASAIERIGRAIALSPDNPAFFNNRGLALAASGRSAEAEADFRRAIALRADFGGAHNNLGLVLRTMGRHAEAADCHRRAIEIRPADASALHGLAALAVDAGDLEGAESHFRTAIAASPDAAELHNDLGLLLQRLERFPEAEQCYRQATMLNPALAQARCNLGGLLRHTRRGDEAEFELRRAIDLAPDLARAHGNLGLALRDQRRMVEAEAALRAALALDPADAELLNNLGTLLQEMLELDEAERCYLRALELKPDFHLAAVNLSLLLLLRGDYARGLPLYERRLDCEEMRTSAGYRPVLPRLHGVRRWDGGRVRGGALLVWAEQGLGDAVMMFRYLPRLMTRGFARVILLCDAALVRLAGSIPGIDEVIVDPEAIPAGRIDFHCPMMSLPLALGTRLGSIPADAPYVHAPADQVARWQGRRDGWRRVGICWAGGRGMADDALRSMPAVLLAPLARQHGVRLVNLRKGGSREELASWEGMIEDRVDDCEDLMDTAALISGLDLVISVDTVVAHLAGALGRPVWLALRFASEWRWMLERADSPWYPTTRIFRQRRPDDWSGVAQDIAADLTRWRGAGESASLAGEKARE